MNEKASMKSLNLYFCKLSYSNVHFWIQYIIDEVTYYTLDIASRSGVIVHPLAINSGKLAALSDAVRDDTDIDKNRQPLGWIVNRHK